MSEQSDNARAAHDDALGLSKDIGKIAERTARLEEGFENLGAVVVDGFKKLEEREVKRDDRDKQIADHMGKVCALAKLGIFLIKWVLPSGGAIGAILAGQSLGWWP